MAVEIYNEGRVTGYSAYETYVKQFLLVNPEGTPATERKWLASSLAMGSSIILKVPETESGEVVLVEAIGVGGHIDFTLDATKTLTGIHISSDISSDKLDDIKFSPTGTHIEYTAADIIEDDNLAILDFIRAGSITIQNDTDAIISMGSIQIQYDLFGDDIYHYVDIPLPTGTSLCAANTIIGTWIDITPNNTDGVPTSVRSYSDYLIPNNRATYYPSSGEVSATNLPTNPIIHYDDPITNYNQAYEYLKIVDGVVLQSGTWTKTDGNTTVPYMMFSQPKFDESPLVRLVVKGAILTDFYILLTGFSDSGVISGVTGLDGAWNTEHPQNGDFLGPSIYPWANKIIFVNSSILEYAVANTHRFISVDVPDFEENKYYKKNGSTYELITSKPNTWDTLNPAIATNESYINCYLNLDNRGYVKTLPAMADTGVYRMNKYNTDIAELPMTSVSADPVGTLDEEVGDERADGNGYINWSQLFRALAENKKIRVSPQFVDILNHQIRWDSTSETFELIPNTGLKVGKNYIDFNGVRLYVSNTEPTGTIPNGSIGIGWTTAS